MVITKRALPRRTFLQGLGVTVGLPLLDAMVPAMSAQTKAAPGLRRSMSATVPIWRTGRRSRKGLVSNSPRP